MSIYKELSYDQEIDVVKGIQFSILGPEEIRARSVVEVTKTDTFTGNEPVVGGLFDPRMGVLEHNRYCSTCEQKNIFCPGHFGHITLARPVFQPMFFDIVRKVLKCVCFRCSRPMISSRSNKPEFASEIQRISQIKNPKKRWDAMSKLSTNTKLKKCGDDAEDDDDNTGCKARQPTRYLKEACMKITAEWKDTTETVQKELTAEDILHIFQRISEPDMELMGFNPRWNKPEWLICTTLAVPPPAVRPSIIEENGQRREDDLTHKLGDIVKFNNQLRTRIESGKGTEDNLRDLTKLIQYHIATFMDNQIPGLPLATQRNGRKLKSIADRLKKKEGRIRGNLNGKRVDQSARSVITPDPYISLDELGVPIKIAMNVTFPEMVNVYNIAEMRKLVLNGPNTWPGAKYVRLSDGVTTTLKYADRDKIAADLKEGDIVDRHIRDGDYVLFNRQPSLHKMSMMCHKVRVMPYQTFRLGVLVTNPYNADFDGDEMNLFASQNVQTMSELMDLAAVPYMILAPRDGKPIVEVVQDTMLGAYRITKDWTTIHDKTMANLQMVNSYFSGQLPDPKHKATHEFSGKQAYSQILPPGLFVEMKNKVDEKFRIINSEIVSGTIDKTVYHSLTRGIIPILYHDYSPFEVRRFLDNTQRLICRWLMSAGFSVGISDLVTDKATEEKLKETIHTYKGKAYLKIEDVRRGKLENNSIFTNQDFFEREILNVLNELTNQVGKIGLKQIDEKTNRMINMVKSGSKGKETNVAQMIACVGQQNVDGKRVAYGFTDRTLPHYTKYDDGPEARGFVENSFISGLSPQEVFFHAMGGREGLIDTAVKTSETGYIQRRLVKAMEDCKVYYDQTVRNATGAIVQYVYGEDGIDGIKIENQYIPYITMNLIEMDLKYNLRPEETFEIYLTEPAIEQMKSEADWMKDSRKYYEQLIDDRQYLINDVFGGEKVEKIQYPIPFDRIIRSALQRIGQVAPTAVQSDLTPGYILDTLNKLLIKLKMLQPDQGIRFLHILLRMHLCPKVLIMEHHMTKVIFEWVVNEIESRFMKSLVHPGEMVGIIAAQSIGELGTQQSTLFSSRILIKNSNNLHYKGKIGEFIDTLIKNNKDSVVDIGGDSCVLTLEAGKNDFSIIGISQDEKTSWNRILQVSRHPAKGGVMKVTTKSGKTTTATLSHSFLKRAEKGIVPVLGSGLAVGDRIPVARYIPEVSNPLKEVVIGNQRYALDHEFGWICGAYLADGSLGTGTVSISKIEPIFEERIRAFATRYGSSVSVKIQQTHNKHEYMTLDANKEYTGKSTIMSNMPLQKWIDATFGRGSYTKSVGAMVFACNKEFIGGILSGYFDGDGSVSPTKQMIRAQSVNESLIDDMILLLAYHGIFASKLKQDREREKATLMWEVSVTKKYAPIFKKAIGLHTPHKAENLDQIIVYLGKVTTQQDYIDMIPELSDILDFLGKRLELPGQSRTFGKFKRLGINRVGREALIKYIDIFETATQAEAKYRANTEISDAIAILKQAATADAVYDEIVSIEYLPDPKEYVYDFTVPGNDSFMVDTGVLVHNTLDSFHSSGTAAAVKATSGVPRLKELLSVSKNIKTPSLLICLKPDLGQVATPIESEDGTVTDIRMQESKEKCIKVMQQLEITRMVDILDSTEIYWDPPGDRGLQTGIPDDDGMLSIYRAFANIDDNQCRSQSPWVLRMKINKDRMYRLGLTMMDIYIKLHTAYHQSIECVFSDDNANELIFRVRLTKEALKDVEPDDFVSALKAMEHNIVNNVLLKGLKGIKKVSMRSKNRQVYNPDKDGFEKVVEWMLDTDGTNLQEILANLNVDQNRTRSNDIYEIYQTLGIEAARNALYVEFMEVVGEGAINYRHMSLLLDTMTNRGTLMSVDRHGINRGDVGPLAKSSFEETTDMLINASMFSEHDRINGVSANIMLGQLPPCGTGDHEILLDEDAFVELMKDKRKLGKKGTFMRFNDPVVDDSTYAEKEACAIENIGFNYTLPEKNTNMKAFPKQSVTFV